MTQTTFGQVEANAGFYFDCKWWRKIDASQACYTNLVTHRIVYSIFAQDQMVTVK